jgi:peptide deformylase
MASRALDDPALEARRLAALAEIRQLGDPVLRTPAAPVQSFDDALRLQAERMARIMGDGAGVGLAANQIGRLNRVLVMRPGEEENALVLCNPRIVETSEEREAGPEGCLSIGEIEVEVERAVSLRVEAQDVRGEPVQLELEGLPARVAQHEIDHLDGILMLDRTTPEQRREALRLLRVGG